MFEKALEEIRRGTPLERVLERYPLSEEEKELLATAHLLCSANQPALARASKKRILAGLRKQIRPAAAGFRARKAILIAAVLLVLTGGTFAFATSSLPSSPLYPVRNAVEKAVVRLLPPGELKAKLMLWTIDRQASQAARPEVESEVKEKVLQTVEKRLEEYRTVREKIKNRKQVKEIEEKAREKIEKLREQVKEKREQMRDRTMEIRKNSNDRGRNGNQTTGTGTNRRSR